ncbi:hypothetical protein ATER59S_05002 [Aquamicrobium terrae]
MSILASLVRAYERLPEAPPFGYSVQNIGVIVGLNPDGSVAGVTDWRVGEGRKRNPRPMLVPQPVKRTAGIAPNFLWDKTSYVLGVTAGEGKRTADEHAAFKERHEKELAGTDDPGLNALLLFLRQWTPEQFAAPLWDGEFQDQNVAFVLEADRRRNLWLHDRPAVKALWSRLSGGGGELSQVCLVTGDAAPVARLHPAIKGVWGGQSSGGSIVSFNLDAFTSYGHEQGENAPVSEAAAFAYTTALNRFLERDSGHRIQIGDASTVFWADASEAEVAKEAEALFTAMFGGETVDETTESKKIGILLEQLKKGEPLETLDSRLEDGVRFHVLGLAPNAARISIRFHYDNDFRELARNYQDYVGDLRFEPRSKDRRITIYNLVLRTAPARRDRNKQIKFDSGQISPLLAGELFRSILTGDRFPRALLAQILMRVRSDQLLDNLRISMIKAVIVRAMRKEGRLPKEDYLVRSDPDDPNTARRLGKLFALIERAQLAALGDEINTTVKDKYLGTCAATPAQVISKLILNAEQHHLKRLRNGHSDAGWIKDAHHARRVGAAINRDLGRLAASFGNNFPAQHSDEEQGLFLIGYYQERYGSRKADDDGGDPSDDEQTKEGEE